MNQPSNNTLRASTRIVCINTTAPDARTALADARTALAVSRGRHLDDIDPSTGYDLSEPAYQAARDGWLERAKGDRFTGWITREYMKARSIWAQRRPDWAVDWPVVDELPEY
ncbi:hypothetical protein ACIPW9_36495 [Streptomyces sp. NPDC090052]|uniref:hypothetical protein n=1 Tax=Streptomyces sp. NPDC090052 TaxID=3365931 RepID=UPI00381F338C